LERRTKKLIFTPKESVKRPGTSAKVSPFDLVRNFVRDGKEIIADKARMVSAETRAERLEICKACAYVKGEGSQIRCMHPKCGCFMAIKAGFKKAKCPVGKWQSE
jgi:hypothetical protein